MRHNVIGAKMLCIHNTEPYSEGASYTLEPQEVATVQTMMHKFKVRNTSDKRLIFKVYHSGEFQADYGISPVVE
jgi:hypothetical protein